jgi:enoyl-CoA hydratase/carnithine racemase
MSNGGSEPVRAWREGPVQIVRLDRPLRRNAVDARTAAMLGRAWAAFENDPEARVAVFTGGDEVFSAGADLTDLAALGTAVLDEDGPLGFTRRTLGKPVIAAIAGWCVAGGLEMACWCDLRIADETAMFGCLERRYGVPLVDGGTQRLPRIVGLGRALDLILSGRRIDAREALAMGLVNEVVPAGRSLARALELANALAEFPRACLRSDRQAVFAGLGLPLRDGLRLEAELGAQVLATGEPAAGAQAFREGKR